MKKIFLLASAFSLVFQITSSQTVLSADSSEDAYAVINAVFANLNRDVVEVPDCNHNDFGKHITQAFDKELNKNVFLFHIHLTLDNDRCKKFDRQRNKIKTYSGYPENLIARKGETVEYKWKFKLSENFKPLSSFTHIHQIKSVGRPYASISMISFTLRKKNPYKLELRYTAIKDQETLKTADLILFKGNWVEVTETIKFDNKGSYAVEIRNISNNKVIFKYSNTPLDTWQNGVDFARPKWGIYRGLKNKQDLQDETVKFADFSIEENPSTLSFGIDIKSLKDKAENILLYPNPSSNSVEFKNVNSDNFDSIEIYDYTGRKMPIEKNSIIIN